MHRQGLAKVRLPRGVLGLMRWSAGTTAPGTRLVRHAELGGKHERDCVKPRAPPSPGGLRGPGNRGGHEHLSSRVRFRVPGSRALHPTCVEPRRPHSAVWCVAGTSGAEVGGRARPFPGMEALGCRRSGTRHISAARRPTEHVYSPNLPPRPEPARWRL